MPPKTKSKKKADAAPAEATEEAKLSPIEEPAQPPEEPAQPDSPVAASEPAEPAPAAPPTVAVKAVPVQPTGLKIVVPKRTLNTRVGGKFYQFIAGEKIKVPASLESFLKDKSII